MTDARNVIAASDCVRYFCGQHKKICLAEADCMIAALEEAGISLTQWQPFETAMNNSDIFLACRINQAGCPYDIRVTAWRQREGEWCLDGDDDMDLLTHWSPLPKPLRKEP